jgi:hypothetical protein
MRGLLVKMLGRLLLLSRAPPHTTLLGGMWSPITWPCLVPAGAGPWRGEAAAG